MKQNEVITEIKKILNYDSNKGYFNDKRKNGCRRLKFYDVGPLSESQKTLIRNLSYNIIDIGHNGSGNNHCRKYNDYTGVTIVIYGKVRDLNKRT